MRLVAPLPATTPTSWPRWPSGWSVVARSLEVKRRGVKTVAFAGRELVLFRLESGDLGVLDAFCPHMGAHLGRGDVVGASLRCPLHHHLIDASTPCPAARRYRVAERFGLVFVTRASCSEPLPEVANDERFLFTTGAPVDVNVPWVNLVLNGFDLPHLEAVHHRALLAPAQVTVEPARVRLTYETRITGSGLSDVAMRWLSANHLRARMSCHGSVVVVEADLGWTQTAMVVGVTPRTETQHDAPWPTGQSRAQLSFGVRRDGLAPRLQAMVTRWLYLAFLGRDFEVLEQQRLTLEQVDDDCTLAVARFLAAREEWAAS